MNSAVIDADDREASVSISTAMLVMVGALVALHLMGIRFAGGVSGSASL